MLVQATSEYLGSDQQAAEHRVAVVLVPPSSRVAEAAAAEHRAPSSSRATEPPPRWQKMNLFREMKRYMENSLIQAAVHGGTLSKILLIN